VPSLGQLSLIPCDLLDFEKERKAFEELFTQGKNELMEIIKAGKQQIASPSSGQSKRPAKTDGHDSDTGSMVRPVSSAAASAKRRKSTPAKRKRSESASSDDKGLSREISGVEAAMRLELDQLRKNNKDLISKLKILESTHRLSTDSTSFSQDPATAPSTPAAAAAEGQAKPENKRTSFSPTAPLAINLIFPQCWPLTRLIG